MEVFPVAPHIRRAHWRLLHVRGGVSDSCRVQHDSFWSSPRPWRCFSVPLNDLRYARVFSTSVEVFLVTAGAVTSTSGLLHVRGGVSQQRLKALEMALSSPRPWRCFRSPFCLRQGADVFSTSVEVFLSTFGDRSPASQSSPRLWRCFPLTNRLRVPTVVFSTSVEVFLESISLCHGLARLLHVRGGVSTGGRIKNDRWQSSPRPWRCFLAAQFGDCLQCVFSTSVEVFPIEKLAGR